MHAYIHTYIHTYIHAAYKIAGSNSQQPSPTCWLLNSAQLITLQYQFSNSVTPIHSPCHRRCSSTCCTVISDLSSNHGNVSTGSGHHQENIFQKHL